MVKAKIAPPAQLEPLQKENDEFAILVTILKRTKGS